MSAPPFHGVAVDAGSGLAAAIRAARGPAWQDDDLFRFKRAVLTALGPVATTVLVDATLGPRLLPLCPPGCAPMMAFEADVYRISNVDRITVLPDDLAVADFPGLGVRLLKFFLWYAPDDDPALNARKHALVEQVGAACAAADVSFLMEPLVYDPRHAPGSAGFAAIKPDLVRRALRGLHVRPRALVRRRGRVRRGGRGCDDRMADYDRARAARASCRGSGGQRCCLRDALRSSQAGRAGTAGRSRGPSPERVPACLSPTLPSARERAARPRSR
jgi:hypothetical protein